MKCLKQFRGILFGFKIEVFSDHKNMVYATTLGEYQRMMRWRLILEEFGPNIQHISGVENIVADTLSILPYASVNSYKHSTKKYQYCANKVFKISRAENNEDCFPLKLLNFQI